MPLPAPLSSPLVRAAALVGLEALALLVFAVVYAVGGLTGDAQSRAGAEVGALLLAGAAAVLLLVARGLVRHRRWARGPAVAVQLLAALTALSLLQTLLVASVVVLVVAAVVLYSLATPQARAALDGDAG